MNTLTEQAWRQRFADCSESFLETLDKAKTIRQYLLQQDFTAEQTEQVLRNCTAKELSLILLMHSKQTSPISYSYCLEALGKDPADIQADYEAFVYKYQD